MTSRRSHDAARTSSGPCWRARSSGIARTASCASATRPWSSSSMTALAEATPPQLPRRARVRLRFAEPLSAFTAIWHNRALRRLEYAWVGSVIGTWAYGVALYVYAYEQGGAAAAGLAGLIRTLPTVFFAPFVASLGDRYPRVRVMIAS